MTRTITDPVELRVFIMSRYESDKDDLGHACMKAVADVLEVHSPMSGGECCVCSTDFPWDGKLCATVGAIVKACAVSFGQ